MVILQAADCGLRDNREYNFRMRTNTVMYAWAGLIFPLIFVVSLFAEFFSEVGS